MSRPAWLTRLLARADVDRGVAFAVANALVRLVCGPVTGTLVLVMFTPEIQGYYYTFASILALQVFVELGMSQVVVQFASHEFSNLSLDAGGTLQGDPESRVRLLGLAHFFLRWYVIAAVVGGVALCTGGWLFFAHSPGQGVSWQYAWVALCLLSTLRLGLTPVWSLLEGCNQIAFVYQTRLLEGFITSVATWICLVSHLRLMAPVFALLAALLWNVAALLWKYPALLRELGGEQAGYVVDWRRDIWPFQWRIAISWISGYFLNSMFTPLAFHFRGPVDAGRIGLSWMLIQVVGSVSSAWIATRSPRFGMLVAQRQWVALDRLFYRVAIRSTLVCLLGCLATFTFVWLLYATDSRYALRLLSPLSIAIFLFGTLLQQATNPMSVYLRAHRKEPYMVPSVVSGLAVALGSYMTVERWGVLGMASSYTTVQILGFFWAFGIWKKCKAEWHAEPLSAEPVTAS